MFTTTPATPLRELARVLGQHGISGMPVVESGRVVGVISEADVLAKARRAPAETRGLLERLLHPGPAEDAAKAPGERRERSDDCAAETIESFCSISTAAARMLDHGVNRLPVVDAGRLVGIVTRADIVRAFARPDAVVAKEARDEISLQQALAGGRGTVEVTVTGGDAVLTGAVRHRIDADVLAHVVRHVPGVVSVRSDVSWSEND